MGPLGRGRITCRSAIRRPVGPRSQVDAEREAILDLLYLPHVLDGTVATANQITSPRLSLVQRQQFGRWSSTRGPNFLSFEALAHSAASRSRRRGR